MSLFPTTGPPTSRCSVDAPSFPRFRLSVSEAYPESLSIEQDHPTRSLEESVVERVIRHVLEAEQAKLVHLSLVLSNHDTVRRLNQSYLEHDYNTDVLSFSLRDEPDLDEDPVVEGEVYVDLDTAAERCDEFDTTYEREALRYVVHGLLHLLGYNDRTEAGQANMRAREDQYLASAAPDS